MPQMWKREDPNYRGKRGDVHVYPQGDLREHDMTRDCWCCPTATQEPGDDAVIVHNSVDGRELVERHGIQ